MRFDEALNRRLSTAAIYQAQSGRRMAVSVSFPTALEMALQPARPLPRGSYRVEWHSVSTDDGYELEGSFSFGVQAPALGGATTTIAGPLAGLGWLRTLLRAAFYPALFLFAGALMLRTLLGGRDRDLWLLPAGVRQRLGDDGAAALVRAERSLVLDADLAATALAAALAVLVDWIHLLAGALWLGGIAVIAWILGWVPARRWPGDARKLCRGGAPDRRRAPSGLQDGDARADGPRHAGVVNAARRARH